VASTRDLLLEARATRPRPTPVAPEFTRPHRPEEIHRGAASAPALLRQPTTARRGNGELRVAAIQRLQQTIGNRATRRLLQRRATTGGGPQDAPLPLQRTPVVIQRAIHWKAERALDYALERGAGQDYVQAKGTFSQTAWLSESKQGDLIHLWTKAEKKKRGHDQDLTDRLELTRAMLLVAYVRNLRGELVMLNQPSMREKRAAETRAYNDTVKVRDNLKGWGLIKTGLFKPELVKEMQEADPNNLVTPNAAMNVGPRIEIRGTNVPAGPLAKLKKVRLHSFIVYTQADGVQRYIAAHSNPDYGDEQTPSPLIATVGLYRPGVHEWDPAADKRVLEDQEPQTAGKWERMAEAALAINAQMKAYDTLKRNCNTAASYVLRTAGVNNIAPPGPQYIGWGNNL
jgi:hypothetical protein